VIIRNRLAQSEVQVLRQPQNNGGALAVEVARGLVGHQNLKCSMRRAIATLRCRPPESVRAGIHPVRDTLKHHHADGNTLCDADTVSCRPRGQQTELLKDRPTTTLQRSVLSELATARQIASIDPRGSKGSGVKLLREEEASVFPN
jgi:hypothetical protein